MAKASTARNLRLCVDTNLMSIPGISDGLQQVRDSFGFDYIVSSLPVTNMITWQMVSESQDNGCVMMEDMDSVIVIIPVQQFVSMVNALAMNSKVEDVDHLQELTGQSEDSPTLSQFILQLQDICPGKRLIVAIFGLENYLHNKNLTAKRRHRAEVAGQKTEATRKMGRVALTKDQVDQAIVLAQVETGYSCLLVNTPNQMSDLIQHYSKAVMEKPKKCHRLSYVFAFMEEGTTGVKPDKTGAGLLKAWQQQLCQIPGVGPNMAEAITAEFSSIQSLRQAYENYPNHVEAWRVTENIVIRRGAGALETNRRVGKQISLALYAMVTSDNPSCQV